MEFFGVEFAESFYGRNGLTQDSKHRMSKELAKELRDQMGDNAYLFCVEKLSNGTVNPQLWRDVLTWLEELNNEPASAGSLTKGESK
jgi:hypothetical protein